MKVPDGIEAIDMDTVRMILIVREDGTASIRGTLESSEVPTLLRYVAKVFEGDQA